MSEQVLRDALKAVKAHALKMRHAKRLQGPKEYQNDPKAMRVWERALYHEGREILVLLKGLKL